MSGFESLPYPPVEEAEVTEYAQQFITITEHDGYTIEKARDDAITFLNALNAVNSGFIDSINRTTRHGTQFNIDK